MTTFTIDTTQYKDGGYFLILETINKQSQLIQKPYFILLGNNTDYTDIISSSNPFLLFSASLVVENLGDREIRQILLIAERITKDIETDSIDYFSYADDTQSLQFLVDTEGYPVPSVPFTAGRILGLLSERKGKYTTAEEYYHKNLINYPNLYNTRTSAEYIKILQGVEDQEKASSSARRLKHTLESQKKNTEDIRTKYLIAVLEKYIGNTIKAEELFKEIYNTQEIEDSSVMKQWAKYQLAVIDKEKGEYNKAIEVFKELLMEERERIDDYARFQLGESYFLKRDFRQALPYYEKIALTHAPIEDRPFALYQTGVCCLELKQPVRAAEYLTILNKDYPQHKLTRQGMYLYAEARYSASREGKWGNDPTVELETITTTLKQVIEKYPNTKQAENSYYLISQSIREVTDELNRRGQYSAAKKTYAQLVGEEAVGMKKKEVNSSDNRNKDIRSLSHNPIAEEHIKRANILLTQNKFKEALICYESAISLAPEIEDADRVIFNIALCYAGMLNYEKAVDVLNKLVEKFPHSYWAPHAMERMAVYYSGPLKDEKKTIEIYSRIIKEYKGHPLCAQAYYFIGVLNFYQGDEKESDDAFKTVIREYPESEYAKRAQKRLDEMKKKRSKK